MPRCSPSRRSTFFGDDVRVRAHGGSQVDHMTAVQIDRAAESITEIRQELAAFAGDQPATAEEVDKIRNNRIRGLPGRYETGAAVLGAISGIVSYDRPDDHVVREQQRIKTMTVEQVRAAAATLDADALTWVVIGDLAQIEAPVRELGLGEVVVLDADGSVLR